MTHGHPRLTCVCSTGASMYQMVKPNLSFLWCLCPSAGKLTIATTSETGPALAGNIVAIVVSATVCVVWTLVSPDTSCDWGQLRERLAEKIQVLDGTEVTICLAASEFVVQLDRHLQCEMRPAGPGFFQCVVRHMCRSLIMRRRTLVSHCTTGCMLVPEAPQSLEDAWFLHTICMSTHSLVTCFCSNDEACR
jgi:hypothetical protein